jgi:predicted membrane channel-forming protein YqfA (hemolysin III family)
MTPEEIGQLRDVGSGAIVFGIVDYLLGAILYGMTWI